MISDDKKTLREWPSIDSYKEIPPDKPRKTIFSGIWHVEEKVGFIRQITRNRSMVPNYLSS
jgi:hypothetical protein